MTTMIPRCATALAAVNHGDHLRAVHRPRRRRLPRRPDAELRERRLVQHSPVLRRPDPSGRHLATLLDLATRLQQHQRLDIGRHAMRGYRYGQAPEWTPAGPSHWRLTAPASL